MTTLFWELCSSLTAKLIICSRIVQRILYFLECEHTSARSNLHFELHDQDSFVWTTMLRTVWYHASCTRSNLDDQDESAAHDVDKNCPAHTLFLWMRANTDLLCRERSHRMITLSCWIFLESCMSLGSFLCWFLPSFVIFIIRFSCGHDVSFDTRVVLGSGFCGFWVLGSGFWVLGSGFWVQPVYDFLLLFFLIFYVCVTELTIHPHCYSIIEDNSILLIPPLCPAR